MKTLNILYIREEDRHLIQADGPIKRCPHCGAFHEAFVPESWIDNGKVVFQ